MVIRSFLENGFEATLSSKINALSVWREHFSAFCKFSSDEVETVWWESEAKHHKLFKSKFHHRKLLRTWFWSYLKLKNKYSERLKRANLQFFANFWVTKLKLIFAIERQNLQDHLNWKLVIRSFLENSFEATLSSRTNVLIVSKAFFSFLWIFQWWSWNHFLGK